jgi:steroid delta-isomerase-like uncharacterized protein
MATEENKALLRRFIEIWNTGNVAMADEFVNANLVDHSLPPGLPPGLAGFKLLVSGFRAAFPDLRITIDDLMAQGDKAAARVTFRGTQQGEFQGIPATAKSFTMGAIGLLRFEAGEVVEHWATLDLLSLLTQLGVAPLPRRSITCPTSPSGRRAPATPVVRQPIQWPIWPWFAAILKRCAMAVV